MKIRERARPRRLAIVTVMLASAVVIGPAAFAQQTSPAPDAPSNVTMAAAQDPQPPDRRSPWMAVPLISSNPKLGTSVGVLGAYVTVFDPGSRVSLFGVMYQYTSTNSSIGGVIARTSFRADHHRLNAIAAFGSIKNGYDDYLGTGQPLKTNDELKSVAGRYLYRLPADWFIGAQGNAGMRTSTTSPIARRSAGKTRLMPTERTSRCSSGTAARTSSHFVSTTG